MANICRYTVVVKGKQNACYALLGSMNQLDDSDITEEYGDDDCYTIEFEGECKHSVDAYCSPWDGDFPVDLPEDPDDAMDEAAELYSGYTLKDRSRMFGVDVFCSSMYEDAYWPEEVHYVNGANFNDSLADNKVLESIQEPDYESLFKDYDSLEVYPKESMKYFYVSFDNPIFQEILHKYNYSSEWLPRPNEFCLLEEIIPGYKGVRTIEEFVASFIGAILSFGDSDAGLDVELNTRTQEIIEGFVAIDGTSSEYEYEHDDDILVTGYDFNLVDGVFSSKFRGGVGGW